MFGKTFLALVQIEISISSQRIGTVRAGSCLYKKLLGATNCTSRSKLPVNYCCNVSNELLMSAENGGRLRRLIAQMR